jgi:hypothetical protein
MTERDARADAKARFEALLAQKGGHRAGGDAPAGHAADRPATTGPRRERPAAPTRTFRRKV